jgi:MFS family permease
MHRHHLHARVIYPALGGFLHASNFPAERQCAQTVDRYGRRPLLMFSATGLSLCFIIAAILLSTGTKPAAYGATAMVFIFQIFLGIGYLPIVSSNYPVTTYAMTSIVS